MSDYYLLEQDLRIPDIQAIGNVPEDLDLLEWIKGEPVQGPKGKLRFKLSHNSGKEITDIVGSLVTVFSNDLKIALDKFGVTNVQYFPCELQHPISKEISENWWLINIVGRVACVDESRSQVKSYPSGAGYILESFYVDPLKASNFSIFRLDEKATLIIITKELREHLRQNNDLGGVRMRHTRVYDGF